MNVQEAADSCRTRIIRSGAYDWEANGVYAASIGHIFEMLDKIVSGEIEGEKAHRWLGWIQALMCVNRIADLKELKEINHNA